MIEAIKEWEKINEQQREYIKVIKGDIESLKESYKIAHKYNEVADKEIERLNNIINNIAVELEILLQSEDFELITMQLRNIVFRLKGSDKE